MKTNTAKNLATIALNGGAVIEREYAYFLPMFDLMYGPMVVFVREESKEEIVICRVYTDNDRFMTDESITLAELEELKRESREYLEEVMEEEGDDQIGEIFTGKLPGDFSVQVIKEELDTMFG